MKELTSGEVVKLEKEGDSIGGVLVSIEESKMFEGSYAWNIRQDEKIVVVFTNEIPVKKAKNNDCFGKRILLEFSGKKKSSATGREYNDYKLFVQD